MKRKKNAIVTRMIAWTVLMGVLCTTSVYADWQSVKELDYTSMSDGEIASEMLSKAGNSFSAKIKGGALDMRSDAICLWRAETVEHNADRLNNSENAKDITLEATRFVSACESPIVYGGVTYEYEGRGNNSVMTGEIGGKSALCQMTYINLDKYIDESTPAGDALRTNASRFVVDTSKFSSDDQNLTIEIMYYTTDAEGNSCELWYPTADGDKSVVVYDETALSQEGATGAWKCARVELSDIDLTRKIAAEGNRNSLRIETAPSKTNYFYSVAVYRTNGIKNAAEDGNIFEQKLAEDEIYGNVKLTYDLTLPSGEKCIEGANYNTGRNLMTMSLADSHKNDFAAVVYETSATDGKIYALTDTGSVELYSGSIVGRTFKCTVQTDMKQSSYTVEIYDGNTLLGKTDEPISIVGRDGAGTLVRAQYLKVKHHAKSKALFSKIGKISVAMEEDENYKKCSQDAEAMALDIPEDRVITDGFILPTAGSMYGSVISWSSSDSSVIKISDDGAYAQVTRSETAQTVTLTGTVSYGDFSMTKDFEVIVKALTGTFVHTEAVTFETQSDGTVTAKTTVYHPGTLGMAEICFAVYEVDEASGDMRYVNMDQKEGAQIPRYGRLDFRVDNLSSGKKYACYLWDEHCTPLVNFAPTRLLGLKAESRATSVNLSWEASFDDFHAIDAYEIYRNGKLIAKCSDTAFRDTTAKRLERQSYKVVPVDTNGLRGDGAECVGKTIEMPYYLNVIGKTEVAINANGNGISMAYRDDPARAAYTEYAEIADISGEKSACRYVPNGKYIGFYTDKSMINTKAVAIEITYLDTEGELEFQYNAVIPEGEADGVEYALKKIDCGAMQNTKTWKKLSIRLDDAQFRESLLMSGADFCLLTKNGSGCYVKRVECIEANLYE